LRILTTAPYTIQSKGIIICNWSKNQKRKKQCNGKWRRKYSQKENKKKGSIKIRKGSDRKRKMKWRDQEMRDKQNKLKQKTESKLVFMQSQ